MILSSIRRIVDPFRERKQRVLHDQSGQSLIILAFAFLGLIAMLGLALDLGLVYIERVRIKRAVDAAALAGVVELPYEEDSFTRAIEYLNLNGYNIDQVNGDANVLVVGCIKDGSGFHDYQTPQPYITVPDARNTFVLAAVPAPGVPRDSSICDPDATMFGNANRLAVTGTVAVDMNFMQFFGFDEVDVQDWAVAQNVTDLDVAVVFDTSFSMEYYTVCYDCWVRTDSTNPNFPSNGYYNPLPASIVDSTLCSATQSPWVGPAPNRFRYLIAEAELAAYNPPLWQTRYRSAGQGYWAIQRGSRLDDHLNRKGDPSQQSSNPCLVAGMDCTVAGSNPPDDVCTDDPGSGDVFVDCSAYISHHPFNTYGQGSPPAEQVGMFYYLEDVTDNDPAPPRIEYDFTPDWNGRAYIWIRAQGGGAWSFEPVYQDPFISNKSTIHWDADNDAAGPQTNTQALGNDRTRDNRADPAEWRWIRLGSTTATAGTPFKLTLWAGSSGYDIDKIVVTNDNRTDPNAIQALTYDTPGTNIGRPATEGSATRAACDPCNPIYGLSVTPDQCTGYQPVLTPTNHLADPLFGDREPLRSSQEAVKRFIKRLDPQFDQAGFVPFSGTIYRPGQSQLECLKRYGAPCYEGGPPISYTMVLGKVENNLTVSTTDIAWGMLEGLKTLGVNVANEPVCSAGRNPVDNNCFDNSCTSDNKTGCGRGGAASRVMVVLTDGSPNENPQAEKSVSCAHDPVYNFPLENDPDYNCVIYYAGKAFQNGVIVYTIGLGDGARGDLLEMAAEKANGRYFFAATPAELDAIFDEILSNIYVRLIR